LAGAEQGSQEHKRIARSGLEAALGQARRGAQAGGEHPAVSCICPTYARPELLEEAIHSFLQQDYAGPKELIVLNDYEEQILELGHPEVLIVNLPRRLRTVGEKMNMAVALAAHDWLIERADHRFPPALGDVDINVGEDHELAARLGQPAIARRGHTQRLKRADKLHVGARRGGQEVGAPIRGAIVDDDGLTVRRQRRRSRRRQGARCRGHRRAGGQLLAGGPSQPPLDCSRRYMHTSRYVIETAAWVAAQSGAHEGTPTAGGV
jgi:cellulose synthase/poly-beta-1,6-N-acetylglucosamine synthase-like glycosyltransferase